MEPEVVVRAAQSVTRWCVDSGANRDICRDEQLFAGNAKPKVISIGEAGQGHCFTSKAEGPISLRLKGEQLPLFTRTIFADQVNENIMSVPEAVDGGYTVIFTAEGVKMYKASDCTVSGTPVIIGTRDKRNRLFYVGFPTPISRATANQLTDSLSGADKGKQLKLAQFFKEAHERRWERPICALPPDVRAHMAQSYHEYKSDYDLWHPRLAHINPRLMKLAWPDLEDAPTKRHCDDCTRGKIHKFGHHGKRPAAIDAEWSSGEYLTCDLFGPLLRSCGGSCYAAFYLDIKSRFVYAKALRVKTDHYQAFLEVIVDVKARSGRVMRFFKTDGDSIFTGADAQNMYQTHAIRHIQSAPGDSSSNDVAERTIRTFAELIRSNLLHANAPPTFWVEAMGYVEYVWNHIPVMPSSDGHLSRTSILEGTSRKYDLTVLRAFGTKCHFLLTLQKKKGKKLAVEAKGQLGAILGIEDGMPAYRVFDFETSKVRKIPFAQTICHEGHYPFNDPKLWKEEDHDLPISFLPTEDVGEVPEELERYHFEDAQLSEMTWSMSPRGVLLPSTPPTVTSTPVPETTSAPATPALITAHQQLMFQLLQNRCAHLLRR